MVHRQNGRERRLEQCQIKVIHQWNEFQVILGKTFTWKFS